MTHDNMDELIRFVEGMALPTPPGVGVGKVTEVSFLDRPKGGHAIIVLDRIEPDFTPDYCTHGRATCISCDTWVWLGHTSHEVVSKREAYPVCRECATRAVAQPGTKYMGRIADHHRSEGPHE